MGLIDTAAAQDTIERVNRHSTYLLNQKGFHLPTQPFFKLNNTYRIRLAAC